MKKKYKFLAIILGITFINIIVLSPGLLGFKLTGDNALETATVVTLFTATLIILPYSIYQIFFSTSVKTSISKLETKEDHVNALSNYRSVKVLKDDISFALEQVTRLGKKKGSLFNVLNQRFEPNELSFGKFTSVILEVEKLFYLNLKNILNKVSIFDESEYKSVVENDPSRFSKELLTEKNELYNEYMIFIKKSISINEEILLDLDKLLLEITRLNSIEIEDIDNMACMKEIDALIKQTKYYKN